MEHARLSSLLVIALLQLSQTEISSTLPESWYAANVISDGVYSPRPLSEIFSTSTEATFSSTNPIVVLPTLPTTPNPVISSSSLPNIAISTSTLSTTLGTTEEQVTEVSVLPLSTERPVQPEPVITMPTQTQPPPIPTVFISTTDATQPPQPAQPAQLQQPAQLAQPQQPALPSQPQQPAQPAQLQQPAQLAQPQQPAQPPQPPQFPTPSQFQQPPAPPSPPPFPMTPQQIQIQTAQQSSPLPPQQVQNLPPQQVQNQPPNYFLLYQQAPQTIQNSPSPQLLPSNPPPPVTTTILPPSTTSTFTPPPLNSVSTQAPCATGTPGSIPPANSQLPTFRIRMVAPSGSITNVRINANPTVPTTTTRRPTTTRTRRRNRNNYDGCVTGCGGTRASICASPSGVSPIDPDTLKGFPSVCHMACHNSFRKTLYEKVTDGKCGRLRTRIRPINANKLKKDDLNKATYTIVQDGPSVVEFSPLN